MKDLGDRTLFDICLELRMAHNGSADPLAPEETRLAVAYLRKRLSEWEPAHPRGAKFDECARQLVIATLEEVAHAEGRFCGNISCPDDRCIEAECAAMPMGGWNALGVDAEMVRRIRAGETHRSAR